MTVGGIFITSVPPTVFKGSEKGVIDMTTFKDLMIQVASEQNGMMVCRETLSSHAEGGYIEVWGYTKPDAFTRVRCGGKCNSMKLKDALMDYIQSDKFDWANDVQDVQLIGSELIKVRHPVDMTVGFLLRIAVE